jgi:hypothetical protein
MRAGGAGGAAWWGRVWAGGRGPLIVGVVVALAVGGLGGFVVASELQGNGGGAVAAPTTGGPTTPPTVGDPTTTRRAPTTRPPTTRPGTTVPSTTGPPDGDDRARSVLGRRDPRPDGVKSFVSAFGGGAGGPGPCEELGDPTAPTVAVPGSSPPDLSRGEVRVGEADRICLFGFEPLALLQVRVVEPTGRVWNHQVCFLCNQPPDKPPAAGVTRAAWIPWDSAPGDALGRYRVAVIQDGATRAGGSFRLGRQPRRMLRVLESFGELEMPRPSGTTIHVLLAGFRPRSTVRLHLYHTTASTPYTPGEYRTTVEVGTDGNGEHLYLLPTRSDDPEGCYVVEPQPEVDFDRLPYDAAGSMAFCLT